MVDRIRWDHYKNVFSCGFISGFTKSRRKMLASMIALCDSVMSSTVYHAARQSWPCAKKMLEPFFGPPCQNCEPDKSSSDYQGFHAVAYLI